MERILKLKDISKKKKKKKKKSPSWIGKQYLKMSIPSKFVYRINAAPRKFSTKLLWIQTS